MSFAQHDGLTADLTKTQDVLGSLGYMSPEQIEGAKTVDARTDVWSLGVVLFRMLTGRSPFVAESPGELVVAICRSQAADVREAAPWVSSELASIVRSAMTVDIDERFATVAHLHAALEALLPDGHRLLPAIWQAIAPADVTDTPAEDSGPESDLDRLPSGTAADERTPAGVAECAVSRRAASSSMTAAAGALMLTAGIIVLSHAAAERTHRAATAVGAAEPAAHTAPSLVTAAPSANEAPASATTTTVAAAANSAPEPLVPARRVPAAARTALRAAAPAASGSARAMPATSPAEDEPLPDWGGRK
jgi:serine/threonine-protein kinase